MKLKKNIYFISDTHLGLYPEEESFEREKILISWLDEIRSSAAELFLLGDIFDFWYEYKHVVPRGFTRFLGRLADMADEGIKISFFSGNHDIWTYSYFTTELGAEIHHRPLIREINGFKFFLAHGDGLGPGDYGYKLLNRIFRNKVLQFLFTRLHPNFALWLGKAWSKKSRYVKGIVSEEFAGEEKEIQIVFAREKIRSENFNFFIFGHRHIPYDIQIAEHSRVINLGDWLGSFTYGVFDGEEFSLKPYRGTGENIILKRLDIPS